ncbi:hypothetical protein AUK18_00095 [Candidatus Beckwithbacteria bacterium CG2_30_44_31]|uniref:GHMP kinase N-terminal domain-containing protein n=1 Tax=Candidatus Beckwithbacteria bacterium CG2_30_44_31 TaxID=1805035 RepID=A0A1J5BBW7_9BACT|nr:MAG: hypothetical protein AUK18_00095 [Candidatus Beckwithbacteria bacterium CG2_30_44_31]
MKFSLDQLLRDKKIKWGNYARGVVNELLKLNYPLSGAQILVDTNFSTSGGLSSSAALELCLAYGLMALAKQPIDPETIAHACQRAENSNLVMSPCGFLDQAVITFAGKDKMVLLDFFPPVKTKLITASISKLSVKRVLDAVAALENNNVVKFGQLLNQSGKSALDLYGLDENTPELRYLMESAQKLDGVLGARNMGGGFSAIILALVKFDRFFNSFHRFF